MVTVNEPTDTEQFSLFSNLDARAEGTAASTTPKGKFSNFIVYVDESGDHGMQSVDASYPVFVLAFCVFYKRHYAEKVISALQKFKFNHFGHDVVVLHETDIRKQTGSFRFLQSQKQRQDFLEELTDIIEESNFILVSCVIDKEALRNQGGVPDNPYHLALAFCLETLHQLMQEKNQEISLTHIVVECRGKKEDDELELEFRRICDGANRLGISLPFDIIFADKKVNSAGLQLADLVARPIGLSRIRPNQPNRAFEVLKKKFFCSGGRANVGEGYEDWGLKIYPAPESERPR